MTQTTPTTSAPETTSPSGRSGETPTAGNASKIVPRKRRVSTWEKALYLLVEGKVKVTFVSEGRYLIRAEVEGDNGSYVVDFGMSEEGRWSCSCPAFKDCSHMRAVQHVTAARGME